MLTFVIWFVVTLFAAGMVESFRDERIAKRERDERIAKMKCRRSESQMTGLQAHHLKLDMMHHNASAPDGEKQSCPAWLESFPGSNSPVVGCDCFVCKPPKNKFGLTPRESEIVAMVVAGYSNKEVAEYFEISEYMVKHHLSNIFDKLGVSTRLELAPFAVNTNADHMSARGEKIK